MSRKPAAVASKVRTSPKTSDCEMRGKIHTALFLRTCRQLGVQHLASHTATTFASTSVHTSPSPLSHFAAFSSDTHQRQERPLARLHVSCLGQHPKPGDDCNIQSVTTSSSKSSDLVRLHSLSPLSIRPRVLEPSTFRKVLRASRFSDNGPGRRPNRS